MIVQGTVLTVELDIDVPKNGGGTYPGGRLTYRDSKDGSTKDQCFHNNVFKFNPVLKTSLANLAPGVLFNMEKEKPDGSNFWSVKSISPSTGEQAVPEKSAPASAGTNAAAYKATPNTSPKSTYQTPEERAIVQVSIVRQSSLSNALKLLELNKAKPTVEEAIKIAKQFEDFVHGEFEVVGEE
jgi:hypothetical protein